MSPGELRLPLAPGRYVVVSLEHPHGGREFVDGVVRLGEGKTDAVSLVRHPVAHHREQRTLNLLAAEKRARDLSRELALPAGAVELQNDLAKSFPPQLQKEPSKHYLTEVAANSADSLRVSRVTGPPEQVFAQIQANLPAGFRILADETSPAAGVPEKWLIALAGEVPPRAPLVAEELQISLAASTRGGGTTVRVDGFVYYEGPGRVPAL